MKETIVTDQQQKGISESALLKNIIGEHYQRNPLVINPNFDND